MKYVKVMFLDKSRYSEFKYRVDNVNIAPFWNPKASTPKEMGGINFSNEENILRWLHNGDTIYDVEVPDDAEVVCIKECATPNGVFRANKIIIKNPRKVTDEMAMEFYIKNKIPEGAFPKAMAAVAVREYYNTAMQIFNEKVNKDNIEYFISEWYDFIDRKHISDCNKTIKEIDRRLNCFLENDKTINK